jgi:hypothetical protein
MPLLKRAYVDNNGKEFVLRVLDVQFATLTKSICHTVSRHSKAKINIRHDASGYLLSHVEVGGVLGLPFNLLHGGEGKSLQVEHQNIRQLADFSFDLCL